MLARGDELGGAVIERVRRGGSGVVYLVRHPEGAREAYKTYREDIPDPPAAARQFIREAQVSLWLENHPNVINSYRLERHDQRPYLVQYAVAPDHANVTLADWLAKKFLSSESLVLLGLQIAHALRYAYGRGCAGHFDVKPSNLLMRPLDASVHVFLADWGSATLEPHLAEPTEQMCCRSPFGALGRFSPVQPGSVTPQYAAPELLQSHGDVDGRAADMYSFGACLAEIATDVPVFRQRPSKRLLRRRIEAKRATGALHSVQNVVDLVVAMLDPSPSSRPSVHDVIATLAGVMPASLDDLTAEFSFLESETDGALRNLGLHKAGRADLAATLRGARMAEKPTLHALDHEEYGIRPCFSSEFLDELEAKAHRARRQRDLVPSVGLLKEAGQYERATAALDAFARRHHVDVTARRSELESSKAALAIDQGMALAQLGQHGEALDLLAEGTAHGSAGSLAWFHRGVCEMRLDRAADAAASFRHAIELDSFDSDEPDRFWAACWNNYAASLASIALDQTALDALSQAMRRDPDYARPWVNAAGIFLAIGDTASARHHAEEALLRDGTNRMAHRVLDLIAEGRLPGAAT